MKLNWLIILLLFTGLVDGRDLVVIAANLQKILDKLPTTTSVTFALVRYLIFILIQQAILY